MKTGLWVQVALTFGVLSSTFVAQDFSPKRPTDEQAMNSTRPTERSVEETLKGVVDWKIERNLEVNRIQTARCSDGTRRNPRVPVCELRYPMGSDRVQQHSADTIPPMTSIVRSVRNKLRESGWRKCTPNEGQDEYYSNVGPWFRETYLKDHSLVELQFSYSQGVGYNLNVQYDCPSR